MCVQLSSDLQCNVLRCYLMLPSRLVQLLCKMLYTRAHGEGLKKTSAGSGRCRMSLLCGWKEMMTRRRWRSIQEKTAHSKKPHTPHKLHKTTTQDHIRLMKHPAEDLTERMMK